MKVILILTAVGGLAASISLLAVSLLDVGSTPTSVRAAQVHVANLCTLYAAPPGERARPTAGRPSRRPRAGSPANPFRTAQQLLDALRPGQTGCLSAGTYRGELVFKHGGRAGRPIVLRNVPGQHAELLGGPLWVPAGSDHVTVAGLSIDANITTQVGIQIMAHDVTLLGNDITNQSSRGTCIILGNNDHWGQAVDTTIEGNLIHQCGSGDDGNQDQAIYFDNSVGATVSDNVIWGTSAFAIHLYEHAVDNTVMHNVIADNGYGVIFAGSSTLTSAGNVVAHNVIADTPHNYDVSSWWGGAVGTGNVLRANCLDNSAGRTIERPTAGVVSQQNVTASPDFIDPRRHDYLLGPSSRCLAVVGYDSTRRLERIREEFLG